MKTTKTINTSQATVVLGAAMALIGGVAAPTLAQTGTTTVTSAGGTYSFATAYSITAPTAPGGLYTYTYDLTLLPTSTSPQAGVNLLTFSFSGTPTFLSASPTSFGPPNNPTVNNSASGYFVFFNFPGLTAASPTAEIVFQAAQAPGGTLAVTSSSNGGDATVTSGVLGPMAAPEPTAVTGLAYLSGSLAVLVLSGKRRRNANRN